jgi:RNA polymerase sigma-70 factor (ECF subfamily)
MASYSYETESDSDLIARIVSGDTEVFGALMDRHADKAFQIAYGILGNRHDAEEVTQDAFIRIFKALPNFRGDAEFSTWMYRIVVNQARNRYRWNQRRGAGKNISIYDSPRAGENDGSLQYDVPDRNDATPDRQLIYQEWEGEIAREMENLPEAHREALILRNVKRFSYDQISDVLDCKVGTVKSRLARAREELRKRLGLLHDRRND